MMGGWLIWLLLGGLFLFLMFRGGGHGDRDDTARGSPGSTQDNPSSFLPSKGFRGRSLRPILADSSS